MTGETVAAVVVVADPDPVARRTLEHWGTPPATGDHVDGAPLRTLGPGTLLLRRPGLHIHDERLDARLPAGIRAQRPTLIFPSIHRSERNVSCLTVHPLGNPGATAEVGGRPRTLVPTDPGRMVDALRRLDEQRGAAGMGATFEATHHGPELELPTMFVEIGYGEVSEPPPTAVRVLADVIPRIEAGGNDRVALAVGGGHYAPHFTDLSLRRSWAFGHILSRHALAEIDRATAEQAFRQTESAEGIVPARVADLELEALRGVGPRLRDGDAPPRARSDAATAGASGT